MANKQKTSDVPKHLIIVGAVLIILAIVFVVLILKQEPEEVGTNNNYTPNNSAENNNESEEENVVFNPDINLIETVDNLDTAIATTAGANLITEDGKVVNNKGQVVQNNALPMTDIAPKLSEPVDPSSLIEGVIKLSADSSGFSPAEFTVKAGEPVTLSLTAVDVGSRLVFESSSLAGLELPVPADYTMAKTFNAPSPGRYVFFQDMPGRTNQKGAMIVVE
jgi:plastocyanin